MAVVCLLFLHSLLDTLPTPSEAFTHPLVIKVRIEAQVTGDSRSCRPARKLLNHLQRMVADAYAGDLADILAHDLCLLLSSVHTVKQGDGGGESVAYILTT